MMKIDKENENVAYNDESHTYWIKNSNLKCISVTTLIGKYGQPFDKEFWSSYKAIQALLDATNFKSVSRELNKTKNSKLITKQFIEKQGLNWVDYLAKKQEILLSWDITNKKACDRGTNIHKMFEDLANEGRNEYIDKFSNGGKLIPITDNKIKDGVDAAYPEILLNYISPDMELKVAGQADVVLVDKDFNVQVLDYKTNKSLDKHSYFNKKLNKYQMMQYPLGHIEDCNYWHYALQLSTYAWMIQKQNPKAKIKKLCLIYINHDGDVSLHECPYLKTEVESLLKDYKSKIKHKSQYDKLKPIAY